MKWIDDYKGNWPGFYFVCPSVGLSVHLSIHPPSVHPSVCLSIRLSVCPSVSPSFRLLRSWHSSVHQNDPQGTLRGSFGGSTQNLSVPPPIPLFGAHLHREIQYTERHNQVAFLSDRACIYVCQITLIRVIVCPQVGLMIRSYSLSYVFFLDG